MGSCLACLRSGLPSWILARLDRAGDNQLSTDMVEVVKNH